MRARARAPVAFLLLLLLPCIVSALVSSENFDGITAQIISNTSSACDQVLDPTCASWDHWYWFQGPQPAQIAIAGQKNGSTFTNGLTTQSTNDLALFLNYNGLTSPGVTHVYFQSGDGSYFKLDSLAVGNNLDGYSTTGTITIYSGGTAVGSAPFDLTTSSSTNGITYTYVGDSGSDSARPYGNFTFDSTYRYVDKIDLNYSSAATPLFDDLNVSSPVVNSAPTVASVPSSLAFNLNTAGNVNLAGTTFADANGDTLTVTLAVNTGTFGSTVADGSGIGGGVTATRVSSTEVTLKGAAADINSYLTTPSNVTYTPPLDAVGSSVATLTISATDGFGGNLASNPTVALAVAGTSQTGISTQAAGVTADLIVGACSGLNSVAFTNAPAGVSIQFPFGLLGFRATGCSGSATIKVTFSQSIPAGSQLYKCTSSTCTTFPGATIDYANNTVTYTVVDGGSGDTDSIAGQITDPAGLGTPLSVPALPMWGETLLAVLLGLGAFVALRRRFSRPASSAR